MSTTTNKKPFKITLDGPAASGKSTTAKAVASTLGFTYIDSGALFRGLTYQILSKGIDPSAALNNENIKNEMIQVAQNTKLTLKYVPSDTETPIKVFIDNNDVSSQIRTALISQKISPVAKEPLIREKVLQIQREIGSDPSINGIVVDGRDIGTVVFPDAQLKIFFTADPKIRAERRLLELRKSGNDVISFEAVYQDILDRDQADMTRTVAPLKKAEGAIEIDSTSLTIPQQIEKIVNLAKDKMNSE